MPDMYITRGTLDGTGKCLKTSTHKVRGAHGKTEVLRYTFTQLFKYECLSRVSIIH
jgi:hypothetical protein